jgi:Ser/Thr protein kinase RdoA (MazF antagonist)
LRWLELLPTVVALAESGLRRHLADALSASTLCHGDLWAPHVHFDGPAFAGLVDFEGLHFGSPAFDLAQLILHFNGWSSRDAVLEAYEGIRPLREEDLSVLPILAAVDLASEGIWSLGRLYGEKGHLAPVESRAHEANLDALLGSLEMIVPSI